ncbi:alpha/beta fold hydrolase [Streptomonospora nanhaiensis]|uniref:alpha/beta fold hydrolase n=1 Tax=Streptomonospora nanhaiensis TaxID=1323731 RepID=UPI001C38BD2E|nr:alpha/beta fold hydrolase [Streptomonospora nanhaiensis]MBV2363155.1 alpha/beta fold hydrolase [Streptomonospora nanhaiensis]
MAAPTTLDRALDTPQGTLRWTRLGRGPAVVLVHGTPFSSAVWHDIAPALARTRTVYLWDLPGFGASDKHPGRDVSLAAGQAALTRLLAHWDLPAPPAVIAHDIGGAVALRTALLDGAAYERLALIDAVATGTWGTDLFRIVRAHTDTFTALPAPMHEALVRAYIAGASHRGLHPRTADTLAAPWLDEPGRAAFYRQIAQADERHTRQIEPLLGRLDCPATVVWGRQDTWLPPEHGHRLARALPRARLEEIDGAGHLVQFDAPAQLTALLLDFLTR